MKSGFCTILGRPNVGKSTLLNALLSKKVSIVAPKAQTTRDDIVGIYNEKESQIVFIDTPGLFDGEESLYKQMNKSARKSLSGVDVVVYLVDSSVQDYSIDDSLLASIKTDAPILVVFNKIDLATAEMMERTKAHYSEKFPEYKQIEISALTNFGFKDLKNAIKEHLNEGELYYDRGVYTDKDNSFMAKEVIREELLHFLKQEIPHECAIIINSYKERESQITIKATIVCEKETQKPIIIGKNGEMIKKVSMTARRNLEKMWSKHVTLYTKVECLPGWRNDLRKLATLGYGKLADEGEDF